MSVTVWESRSFWKIPSPIGLPGYRLPDTGELQKFTLSPGTRTILLSQGITLSGETGSENQLWLSPSDHELRLRINLNGRSGNLIVLEAGCNVTRNCSFSLEGDGHTIIVRQGRGLSILTVTMRSDNGLFYYGRNCTSNHTNCLVHGPAFLCIGDDGMFATNTVIRTYDSHAIIDTRRGVQINEQKSITLGRHVWLGQDTIVMPGVTIGDGAIVGAGAIVTRPVEPITLVAGIPAKVIRRDVTWTREPFPTAEQIRWALESIADKTVLG